MKQAIFLCYPRCSTCKKAEKWLADNDITVKVRNIKEDNPTAQELRLWHEKSGLPLKRFFNTSGLKYKELNLKEKLPNMSDNEKIKLLVSDGMLIKRPIFISEKTILLGFKEKEWEVLK